MRCDFEIVDEEEEIEDDESGGHLILALFGEQGSAKTSTSRRRRQLVDPCAAPLQSGVPKDKGDVTALAAGRHVIGYNNLSYLPDWFSDLLCCVSDGMGDIKRSLFTNNDAFVFEGTRPVIFNGIPQVAKRPDLIDRAIIIALDSIMDGDRKLTRQLAKDWRAVWPRVLGALLDLVSRGIRRLPTTTLKEKPRMADAALWAVACGDKAENDAGGIWGAGEFMTAYLRNRAAAVEVILASDTLVPPLRAFVARNPAWKGTAEELLLELNKAHNVATIGPDTSWPRSADALGSRLMRTSAPLRTTGLSIDWARDSSGGREQRIISFSYIAAARREGEGEKPA